MPKLSETLKKIDPKIAAEISEQVDEIKARAILKTENRLTELEKNFKDKEKLLKEFESKKWDDELKKAFTEKDGNPEKYESFKKVAGKIDDISKIEFDKIFDEFPSLKSSNYGNPFSSNLSNTTNSNQTGGETLKSGEIENNNMGMGNESGDTGTVI